MARTKKSAPAAPTMAKQARANSGKRARARAHLVDQLEQDLLKLKPLVKILRVYGVDPASPDAKRLVSYMLAGLYQGSRKIERRPRQTIRNAMKWTQDHNIALMLEVVDRLKQGNISEREAIKQIAAESRDNHPSLAHRFPYKPQTGRSEAGRQFSQSTSKERYEEALWQRWKKIKQDEKAQTIVALPDGLLIAFGFSPTSEGGEN